MDDATVLVRYLLGALMLGGAVVYDLRERRVPNPWWIPFVWLAGVLVVGDLLDPDRFWPLLGLRYSMAAIFAGLVYLLWRFHLFGGADAKGLMILAFLAPWPAEGPDVMMPALDALANGVLFMLALPAVYFVLNAVRGRLQMPAAFLGMPRSLQAARASFVWPMQVVDASAPGGLRWRYWQRIGGDLHREYHALEAAGLTHVWVTPKVPLLVPVAVGWLVMLWHGNLILAWMAKIV